MGPSGGGGGKARGKRPRNAAWAHIVETKRRPNGRVDGECSYCGYEFTLWQAPDLVLHLANCSKLDPMIRAQYKTTYTAAVAALDKPAAVSERRAGQIVSGSASQSQITDFVDRKLPKDEKDRLRAQQFRMHAMCNISFAAAGKRAYKLFFKMLRPSYKPAGEVGTCTARVHRSRLFEACWSLLKPEQQVHGHSRLQTDMPTCRPDAAGRDAAGRRVRVRAGTAGSAAHVSHHALRCCHGWHNERAWAVHLACTSLYI